MLDGTVQPMTKPELNLADTHLAKALDELARLAEAPAQKMVAPKSENGDADENDAENQIPQPLPEPIPIEVPLPPTPIVLQPPANVVLNGTTENGTPLESTLLAELAALSANAPPTELRELPQAAAPAIRSQVTETTSIRLAITVLIVFLAGMLVERFIHVLEMLGRPSTTVSQQAKAEADESLFSGRITYKTKEGESLPDKGARVLVFPQQRSGEVKLSIVGFRPADSAADQLVANAALKALGGGAATVDEKGQFRLPIDAGNYQLLVISHYQLNENPKANPALSKLLADYFDKPDELLGKVQTKFSPLRIKGTGDIFDQSF